jgi:hypothetical protein
MRASSTAASTTCSVDNLDYKNLFDTIRRVALALTLDCRARRCMCNLPVRSSARREGRECRDLFVQSMAASFDVRAGQTIECVCRTGVMVGTPLFTAVR